MIIRVQSTRTLEAKVQHLIYLLHYLLTVQYDLSTLNGTTIQSTSAHTSGTTSDVNATILVIKLIKVTIGHASGNAN